MTDENKDLLTENNLPEQSEAPQEQSEFDPVLEKAKKYGYKDISREEWAAQGNDPDKYKTPEDFLKYGESYEILEPLVKSLKKEISKRDRMLETIIEDNKRIREQEQAKAKAEIEHQLKLAKELGNVEQVAHLTEQKVQFDQYQQQLAIQKATEEMNAANNEFITRNANWYNDQNPQLQERARQLSTEYRQRYPNDTFFETVKKVEDQIKYEHPEIQTLAIKGQQAHRPNISTAQSQVNKSAVTTPEVEDRSFRNLSSDMKDEYQQAKSMIEKMRQKYNDSRPYTVKDFLNQQTKFRQQRSEK